MYGGDYLDQGHGTSNEVELGFKPQELGSRISLFITLCMLPLVVGDVRKSILWSIPFGKLNWIGFFPVGLLRALEMLTSAHCDSLGKGFHFQHFPNLYNLWKLFYQISTSLPGIRCSGIHFGKNYSKFIHGRIIAPCGKFFVFLSAPLGLLSLALPIVQRAGGLVPFCLGWVRPLKRGGTCLTIPWMVSCVSNVTMGSSGCTIPTWTFYANSSWK